MHEIQWMDRRKWLCFHHRLSTVRLHVAIKGTHERYRTRSDTFVCCDFIVLFSASQAWPTRHSLMLKSAHDKQLKDM